jgi:DNA-directed RNA polymerase specialized sigma24 family protein
LSDWKKYNEKSTIELIELIQWKGLGDYETDEASKQAFVVFYDRFKVEVTRKCEVLCRNHGHDSSVALQLVDQTFQKFLKSTSFKCDSEDEQDCKSNVLFYLFSISYRCLIDYYRTINGLRGTKYTGKETLVYDIEELDIFKEKIQTKTQLERIKEVLTHALGGLSEKQRLIYLTYFNAKVNEGEKPPRHLSKLLREATGLVQPSIRSEVNKARKLVEATTRAYAKM